MLRLLRSFCRRADGNVAVTFALTSLPIIYLMGAALDYSRATSLNAKVQADIDATTLALCKSTATTTSALTTTAQAMLNAYSPTAPVTVDTLTVTSAPRAITLSGHLTYNAAFTQLMGIPTIKVAASASCSAGQTFYEVALVVDTTGSMANSAGGVSKMQALQTAATNFVNTMFGAVDTAHLKISLVPFAASVKVDPTVYASATWLDLNAKSSLHWQNVSRDGSTGALAAGLTSRFDIFKKLAQSNSDWAWKGCLESLPYPLNVSDGAPSLTNPDSYYVPLFAPDELGTSPLLSGSNNSYMDDGQGLLNACSNINFDNTQRMIQGCKYAAPKNIKTAQSGPNWMCDARALTRLTSTKATLLSEISLLAAAGNTDIHEGIMWGWRTISPTSVFADGAPYQSSTVNTVKIIVVMTDGTNTWTDDILNPLTASYYSAYGYYKNGDGSTPKSPTTRLPATVAAPTSSANARTAIDALTTEACTNVKATGIKIYAVAFSVPTDPIDTAGQTLLQNCASQTSNYFLASDSTALNTAFGSIAQGIGQLRLTK